MSAVINLKKSEGINLSKSRPNLKSIRVGLGWSDQSGNVDLDASVFACTKNNRGEPKLFSEQHFVFYNNKATPNGSIVHSGDDRTGGGDSDNESIIVNLSKIEPEITELSFIVTIHEAVEKRQHFGQLGKSYIRIYDEETNNVVCEYTLHDNFDGITGIQFGSVVRGSDNTWTFNAIGAGYKLTLGDFVNGYLK